MKKYKYALQNNKTAEDDGSRVLKEKAIEDAKAEIEKINLQITKTYDLLEQGIYSTEVFTERNKTLSSKKSELEIQISKLRQELAELHNTRQLKYDIIPKIEHVLQTYNVCKTAEEKNNLLKAVVKKINYYKNTPNHRGQIDNANFELDLEINLPGGIKQIFMP